MNSGDRLALNLLMTQLADGDRSVFDEVYALLFPIIKSFATKYTPNEADREDIAQHTLIKIFDQAKHYDRTSDALAWILTIASFECRTLRQKYRRRREEQIPESSTDTNLIDPDNPEQSVLDSDLKQAVLLVLEGLRAEDQETILASVLEQQKPNVSAATFRKRLQRSLASLRAAWRAEYGTF